MDEKKYRVCDQCDHQMTNRQFKEKLLSDIERKKEIGAEVKKLIAKMNKNLREVNMTYEKLRKQK